MRVAFVVPVMHNFKGFTELMQTVQMPVQPIVIDNWTENKGVAAAWNEGLRRSKNYDYAFIVNDDVRFRPGAMHTMLHDMRESGADLVSATPYKHDSVGFKEVVDNESPDFAAFLVRPWSFMHNFGMFDENFYPAYFEDNDMRHRIKVAGGKQGISLCARMDHGVSVTQNWNGERVVSHEQFEKNKAYYVSKWGGEPGNETTDIPFGADWQEL